MSTFQTPQFIEEKAKIVGPFTLKQFLFLVMGGGISFASFYVFSFLAKGPTTGTIRGRQGDGERFQAVRFLTGESRQARRVDYKE